jgi:hypothetical protein
MKKLNLSEMALAAEILGGVAVVVTLVFLVLATRENTNAIQAQTYQALTSELNAIRLAYSTSDVPDSYVILSTEGIQALSDAARARVQFVAEAKWGVYESAFFRAIAVYWAKTNGSALKALFVETWSSMNRCGTLGIRSGGALPTISRRFFESLWKVGVADESILPYWPKR